VQLRRPTHPHYCSSKRNSPGFQLGRRTQRKRMRAKLQEIKATLRRLRHTPIDEQGQWLGTVIKGYFAYFAVQHALALGLSRPHQRTVVP
jgi:RNA-directed DNA polymerase